MVSIDGASREPERSFIGKLASLKIVPDVQIQIEHCEFLASYNWTHAETPTIFVPGIAPTIK
jgi:hypothetical protein